MFVGQTFLVVTVKILKQGIFKMKENKRCHQKRRNKKLHIKCGKKILRN